MQQHELSPDSLQGVRRQPACGCVEELVGLELEVEVEAKVRGETESKWVLQGVYTDPCLANSHCTEYRQPDVNDQAKQS